MRWTRTVAHVVADGTVHCESLLPLSARYSPSGTPERDLSQAGGLVISSQARRTESPCGQIGKDFESCRRLRGWQWEPGALVGSPTWWAEQGWPLGLASVGTMGNGSGRNLASRKTYTLGVGSFFPRFTYLSERQNDRKRLSVSPLDHSPMATMVGAGPSPGQEPGTPAACPTRVAGAQALGPSSTASPRAVSRGCTGIGTAGTQTGTPIWDPALRDMVWCRPYLGFCFLDPVLVKCHPHLPKI